MDFSAGTQKSIIIKLGSSQIWHLPEHTCYQYIVMTDSGIETDTQHLPDLEYDAY